MDNRTGLTIGVPGSIRVWGVRLEIAAGGLVHSPTANLRGSVQVTDSGSVWRNTGDLFFSNGSGLVISNGGALVNSSTAYLGFSSSSNTVEITGTGSVWTNNGSVHVGESAAGAPSAGNKLIISGGGVVFDDYGYVGFKAGGSSSASSNQVFATGTGSLWHNANDLHVGYDGSGNSLVISNGARVINNNGYLGLSGFSSNNSVLVTGIGSVWSNRASLYLGWFAGGAGNTLTISDGGAVVAGGVVVVPLSGAQATLIVNGGTLTAGSVVLTNSTGRLLFNGGVVDSKGTAVTNTQQFVVGNGTNSATFHLLGGAHSFNNGLRIRTNSLLTGCGTVNGTVVIDPGGAAHANCTNLVFAGNVTNNGSMVVDGAVLETFSTFVNNGKIFLLHGGTTNFHATFINNGAILNGDVRLTIERDSGGGLFIRFSGAPDVTYRLQRAGGPSGSWTNIATNTMPASALIEYHQTTPPPGQSFYRTAQP